MARELKYHSPNTDLAALQRELAGNRKSSDDEAEEYGEHAGDADDEDDSAGPADIDLPWAEGRR